MNKRLIFGLDIGIGSVGWAVVSQNLEDTRIEDFGVRLFESGESNRGKDRTSQDRRGKRSARRLLRRRRHRRERLKYLFKKIGMTDNNRIQAWYESNNPNIFNIRAKGIDGKLSPEELMVCLIHISNHRGYRDFYEIDEEGEDKSAIEEAKKDQLGISAVEEIFERGSYRTVGEMFAKDAAFKDIENPNNLFPLTRNRDGREYRYIVARKHHEKEVSLLLEKQAGFYLSLTPEVQQKIKDIIFSQRDFEDGPGDINDPDRRYKGFIDNIGKCMFYKEEDRGFRCTVLADIYAIVNTLSQYSYIDLETGELNLPKEAARALISHAMQNAGLKINDIKTILKKYNTGTVIADGIKKDSLSKAIKYLKQVRTMLADAGFNWIEWIGEEQLDLGNKSRLHLLGEVLSKYQTPHRREKELKKLGFVNEKLIKTAHSKKFSGTSNVSYKYMVEAINAFLSGETYGNFQAARNKEKTDAAAKDVKSIASTLPTINDMDIVQNPVVFRAINETRKIINALVGKYGSPASINIEVASDLGRSYEGRLEITREHNKYEKEWEVLRNELTDLYKGKNIKITDTLLERYKLYKLQKCQCLYSGQPIDLMSLATNKYEVDHIVPFSLILDNTINNKALVLSGENQKKRQRVPLQYMNNQQAGEFKARVAVALKDKKISQKKYNYLFLQNLDDEKLLDEWKSRNINDTRYITKYITNYLQKNMLFASEKDTTVYGVKGAVVSRFRRVWLNKKTWGSEEKDREGSNLHHAVDAIVVANLTPAYIEIASDNMKLHKLLKRNNNVESDEYKEYLANCIKKMKKHYGFDSGYSERLLRSGVVPSLVRRLRDEVDIRCIDNDEKLFRTKVKEYYHKDPDFASGLCMPLVSYKQTTKFKGEVSAQNPISVREIDGQKWEVKRVDIKTLKAKDLERIITGDFDLLDSLKIAFEGQKDDYKIEDFLKDQGLPVFVTVLGRRIYKVTVKFKALNEMPATKEISDKNRTVLDTRKYYCLEIYKDKGGKTCARGIQYVDVVKRQGKLCLKTELTENYCEHTMYLFANDYIEVFNKQNKLKFKGFYKSIKNINRGNFYGVEDNKPRGKNGDTIFSIGGNDIIRRYHIDLLGKRGGEIKCGAPLLSLREKS